MIVVLTAMAWAFDPTTPAKRFEGDETWTQTKDVKIWAAIERWSDPNPLFTQEAFNAAVAWKDTAASPWIATCFGDDTPKSGTFLLHVGIHEKTAEGTPILMVPGAGDNGTRAYVTLGTKLDKLNRPVFALTFAHPHGDVFQQAEVVADAIAVIKARTGAAQVDVVAHSKGGLAAVTYAASGGGFGSAAYASKGTAYRGDVRKLVLVAAPLGGIDTAFRWSSSNYFSLERDAAVSPSAWTTYYPYGTAYLTLYEDLSDQDFLAEDGDLFPGQRQLLARQDHDLPGTLDYIGGYAYQQDWYTTYEGGFGFYSYSDGIDAAIADGGDFIAKLKARGIDPGIATYLLAGRSPLMPNGDAAMEDLWSDVATESEWKDLIDSINAHGTELVVSEDELDGLERGKIVLGEVTGASDGVVFVDSAADAAVITRRGGEVVESYVANLSHLDLLYASPITGQLLIDAADDAAGNAWMRGVGERYRDEDALGWIVKVVADPEVPDTGDTDVDTDTETDPGDTDPDTDPGDTDPTDTGMARPCGGCQPGEGSGAWLAALGVAAMLRRSKARGR